MQRFVFLGVCGFFWVALAGASCKKSTANPEDNAGVVSAIDKAEKNDQAAPATPLPGIDDSKLSERGKKLYYKLVASLPSPCGKAHSLRTSVTDDMSCKRAPYAAKLVLELVDDAATEEEILEIYDTQYRNNEVRKFAITDSVPHEGRMDAKVQLVEFFDYGCPACAHFKPAVEEAIKAYPAEAVLFYKMYPLPMHPDSGPAAQAALAALAQGKFPEMHDLLFENAPKHKQQDLSKYAVSLDLDLGKFVADFEAADAAVKRDVREGEANDVHGTPTLFINGRRYGGPGHPKYIKMIIDEELAVNR